jgi:type I restriction enzyme S subunit
MYKRSTESEKRVAADTESAERITQAILAKAFRGELVPQDPNDEPASVLLERIKNERRKQKKGKFQLS